MSVRMQQFQCFCIVFDFQHPPPAREYLDFINRASVFVLQFELENASGEVAPYLAQQTMCGCSVVHPRTMLAGMSTLFAL